MRELFILSALLFDFSCRLGKAFGLLRLAIEIAFYRAFFDAADLFGIDLESRKGTFVFERSKVASDIDAFANHEGLKGGSEEGYLAGVFVGYIGGASSGAGDGVGGGRAGGRAGRMAVKSVGEDFGHASVSCLCDGGVAGGVGRLVDGSWLSTDRIAVRAGGVGLVTATRVAVDARQRSQATRSISIRTTTS